MKARAKKHIGFRLDPEQLERFEQLVANSGLTAQDYCVDRVLTSPQPEANQLEVIRALTETIKSQQETIERLTKKSAKSLQDSEQIRGIEATKILESIDSKKHREGSTIYYDGSLYWVSKSPNGCQDVLEKQLEIPTELAEWFERMIYPISLRRFHEAVGLYKQLVDIPGFDKVDDKETRQQLLYDCLRAADYDGSGDRWLVEAESKVKQYLNKILAHTHTEEVLTHDLGTNNLQNPEPEPDSGVDKLLTTTTEVGTDMAESLVVTEETVLAQEEVVGVEISRDAFAARYGLDVSTQAYSKALQAAKSVDGWIAPDGLIWFATGAKSKVLWKAKQLAKV
jgi:hypothetical protein